MWGNLPGWIISAALALIMGYVFYTVAAPPSPTEATNSSKLAAANGPIALPVSPESVVARGTQDCDAADSYRKAIDDYTQTPQPYENFLSGGQLKVHEDQMPAVADILAARDCKNFNLFGKDLGRVVNYQNTEPDLVALQDTGRICCTLGLLYTSESYNPKQPEHAVKLWESAFVLGEHLYTERACWKELEVGHDLMQEAATGLLKYYTEQKDATKAEKLQEFSEKEVQLSSKLVEAYAIIGGIDESYAGKYAGDIFKIALNPAADPMFRVEAIKHIGHYRFNSLTSGDQLRARKVLKDLIADKSLPANVKTAAQAAHDLTLAEHNKVG